MIIDMRMHITALPQIGRALLFAVAACTLALTLALPAHAAPSCTFDRDLDVGDEGDDVLCLQQYLNESGYTVALEGPGSIGNETDRFGGLTRDALAAWQEANSVYPASGYFGPLTRAAIMTEGAAEEGGETDSVEDTLSSTGTQLDTSSDLNLALSALSPENRTQAEELLTLLSALGVADVPEGTALSASAATQKPVSTTAPVRHENDAAALILKAIKVIRDADDAIEDSEADADVLIGAREDIGDAHDDLMEAMEAYLLGDSADAYDAADHAYDNALDAYEDASDNGESAEAEDRLSELEDEFEEALEDVDEAEDDGEDTDKSEYYLTEAGELLEETEDLIDDEEYEEAFDLLDEVEELIDDALSEIGEGDDADDEEKRAARRLDDADEAIDDAYDAVEEAIDDNDDVDEAEELLDEAEIVLEEAEEAYEDGDYDEAIELSDEAIDLAEEAVDAL